MKRRRGRGIERSRFVKILCGVCFSFAALVAVSLIASAALSFFKDPLGSIKPTSLFVFLLCGAISGFVISKKDKEGGFRSSILTSVIFIAIIFSISLVISGGSIFGGIFMSYGCYAAISALFAFFAKRKSGRRHR